MKCLRVISYILGVLIFMLGLYFMKKLYFVGVLFIGIGLFTTAMIPIIPEPKTKRYKLTKEDIDEIITISEKDSIEREIKFLSIERDREIIDLVADWNFEECLIALHTIEKTQPKLVTGKGVTI